MSKKQTKSNFFHSDLYVIPFDNIEMILPTTSDAENHVSGITVFFKNRHGVCINGMKDQENDLAFQFSEYLKANEKKLK